MLSNKNNSEQRYRSESRCERGDEGFLGTRWRPGLSMPLLLIEKSIERLIANWAQSSFLVSQGLGVGMAAGAVGVMAATEASQVGK